MTPAADDDDLASTRFRGFRCCEQCPWQASVTGESAEDVEQLLQRVFNEHVTSVHAGEGEHVTPIGKAPP